LSGLHNPPAEISLLVLLKEACNKMLRPKDVLAWYALRTQKGKHEILQLVDGLMVGGQIVLGGSEVNATKAISLMGSTARLGRLVSIERAQLDPNNPTTFDTAAIVQLIAISKNEGFHESVEATITSMVDLINDGHDVEVAAQVTRERAAQVGKL
jgi:hypothetical protein